MFLAKQPRVIALTVVCVAALSTTCSCLFRAWAAVPYTFETTGNAFDANRDGRADFWHDIYGAGLIDSLYPAPCSYRTFTKSYQLGCRSTAQVLVTADLDPPQVFLVDAGVAVGEAPPPGATWASSSTGYSIYFEEGHGDCAEPNPESYFETYTAVYGPLADKPEGYAIGRYQAADGWHYGWIQFTRAGTWRIPPGDYDLTAWSFHSRPNLPIYAGEDPTPRLRAAVGDGQVTISWTSREDGFVLESASRPSGVAWSQVPGVVQEGMNYQVTLPLAAAERYFRLRK